MCCKMYTKYIYFPCVSFVRLRRLREEHNADLSVALWLKSLPGMSGTLSLWLRFFSNTELNFTVYLLWRISVPPKKSCSAFHKAINWTGTTTQIPPLPNNFPKFVYSLPGAGLRSSWCVLGSTSCYMQFDSASRWRLSHWTWGQLHRSLAWKGMMKGQKMCISTLTRILKELSGWDGVPMHFYIQSTLHWLPL